MLLCAHRLQGQGFAKLEMDGNYEKALQAYARAWLRMQKQHGRGYARPRVDGNYMKAKQVYATMGAGAARARLCKVVVCGDFAKSLQARARARSGGTR